MGIGIVNSLFALITILVLTAFMLGSGRQWVDAALRLRPPEQRVRLERSLDRIAGAVGGYVAGAMFIAFIAGRGHLRHAHDPRRALPRRRWP